MAAASPLQDIDDKFCLCSICLEQLKEPKLLPCLHRYCRDCLSSIIQGRCEVIKCPECREEIQIPTNGVDEFKTDFYSKNLVEYVRIQQSLKSDEIRECYSCSKHLIIVAYCFKCNDFLCKDCHYFHVTNKTLKDHQKHTLSLEDIEAKKITIEKLASMRDDPRCHIHLEKISELCCETCDNLPICVACMHGEHKGHSLHEVKALAKLKRLGLTNKLKELKEIQKDTKLMAPRQAKEKLILNVSIERVKAIKMHDEKDRKIMTKIEDIEERRQQVKQEKQNTVKKIFDSLQREMENEIKKTKKKYLDIFKKKTIEVTDFFKARESSMEKELAKLCEKRVHFDRDKQKLLESVEKQLKENLKIIETMSEHYDNMKKRHKTLNVMASSILASENDWSAVQCIPDMCTAATNLMKDLKKDFPELTTLTDVTVNYKQYSFGKPSVTNISDEAKKTINVNDPYECIYGMTSTGDGNIVISGCTSHYGASFIAVIDINGTILQESKMNAGNDWPVRYCEFLSQHKVGSICDPHEIGLYDVRDGSYIKRNISDVISSWPKDRYVRCLATDPVSNHILVGGDESRDVYVFDDQLNYLHILTLPEMIKWPRDITVSDGHLLVCDHDGEKCYVTTLDGLESELVGEFMKPDLGKRGFGPISVCSDKNGFMYVLWKTYTQYPYQCYLVQYNQDGSQVLTTKQLEGDAKVVTVVETPQGEKLVVATYEQTVYLYDLIVED
ncbi:E3 ubiquitin-protein ligase TRIM56 [Holothuria leucospilota]|uniref:E3 ubiquitin-protein ligase TRIM56 n=1 Tax=Holothuria leucospilota TaxID=206669 RepID=A0A9Q1CJQ0_HOLLE|nr:E3 ubiquitin-protein ligase TRIM56 [Holothuria leucospilota]